MSSVVPHIAHKVHRIANRRGGLKIWEVGRNLRLPLKHNYKHINKLGSDRRVTAYGALKIYGAPLLILDYGTALTCDYISKKGTFEGGLIIPGPEISLQALCQKAALLPSVAFPKEANALIGRDTRTGMEAGILQAYGALTDGLVERFKKRYGNGLRVVATGGLAKTIARYSSEIDKVDPLLTLRSLHLAFRERVKLPS